MAKGRARLGLAIEMLTLLVKRGRSNPMPIKRYLMHEVV
jgi:hypothetical protein